MRSVLLLLLVVSGCAHEAPPNSVPETPIDRGLKWLALHQAADGHWGAASFVDRCVGTNCTGPGDFPCNVGVTGLAVLAFLGAGRGEVDEVQLTKAVDWLLAEQDAGGCIGRREEKYMYNHAIATIALCEAILKKRWMGLKIAAQKAIDFLVASQTPGKGWRYTANAGESDSSVTAWCVLALWSAELSGLNFPRKCYDGALAWYEEVTERDGYRETGYVYAGDWRREQLGPGIEFDRHPTMTAGACLSRFIIQRKKHDVTTAGLDLLVRDLPKGRTVAVDYYYWFFGSAALRYVEGNDGTRWKQWAEALKGALEPGQSRDGCAFGSWNPEAEKWFLYGGGRVSATAIAILTLELLDSSPGILALKGKILR